MSKKIVSIKRVKSATVEVHNLDNPDRKYDIEGRLQIGGANAGHVQNGLIRSTDTQEQIGSFMMYGPANRNITYSRNVDIDEMCEIQRAVMECVSEAESVGMSEDPAMAIKQLLPND